MAGGLATVVLSGLGTVDVQTGLLGVCKSLLETAHCIQFTGDASSSAAGPVAPSPSPRREGGGGWSAATTPQSRQRTFAMAAAAATDSGTATCCHGGGGELCVACQMQHMSRFFDYALPGELSAAFTRQFGVMWQSATTTGDAPVSLSSSGRLPPKCLDEAARQTAQLIESRLPLLTAGIGNVVLFFLAACSQSPLHEVLADLSAHSELSTLSFEPLPSPMSIDVESSLKSASATDAATFRVLHKRVVLFSSSASSAPVTGRIHFAVDVAADPKSLLSDVPLRSSSFGSVIFRASSASKKGFSLGLARSRTPIASSSASPPTTSQSASSSSSTALNASSLTNSPASSSTALNASSLMNSPASPSTALNASSLMNSPASPSPAGDESRTLSGSFTGATPSQEALAAMFTPAGQAKTRCRVAVTEFQNMPRPSDAIDAESPTSEWIVEVLIDLLKRDCSSFAQSPPAAQQPIATRKEDLPDPLDCDVLSEYLVADPQKLLRPGESVLYTFNNVWLRDTARAVAAAFDYAASKEDVAEARSVRGNLYITNFALYFIPFFSATYARICQQARTFGLTFAQNGLSPIYVADGPSVRDIRPLQSSAAELAGGLPVVVIPHLAIFKVQKVHAMKATKKKKQELEVLTKDFRWMRLAFLVTSAESDSRQTFVQQLKAAMPSRIEDVFAFTAYRMEAGQAAAAAAGVDGWQVYDAEAELRRILRADPGHWRITGANQNYALCDTYPRLLGVPRSISDEQLGEIRAFRSRGRLPALVWLHPKNIGVSLTRCAQPLAGLSRQRCPADEEMISAIASSGPRASSAAEPLLYLMDARPRVNAMANAAMGAGVEAKGAYKSTKIRFLGIDNIHAMRSSMSRLLDAIQAESSNSGFFANLDSSKWLDYVGLILYSSVRIARLLHVEGLSVLIHCSDGWDRTPQLSSLPLLMLDPYYRTVEGFIVLIEKEWIAYSHKFAERCGHFCTGERDSEFSPVFLQFVDCVWQLSEQFPTMLEFNERLLVDLLDSLCSGLYGTFLCNSSKEVEDMQLAKTTHSIWTQFLVPDRRDLYRNPLYQPTTAVFFPNCHIRHLRFWRSYYLRHDPGYHAERALARYFDQQVAAARHAAELKEQADMHLLRKGLQAHSNAVHLEDRSRRLLARLHARCDDAVQARQRELDELNALLKSAVAAPRPAPSAAQQPAAADHHAVATIPTSLNGSYLVCLDGVYLDLSEL